MSADRSDVLRQLRTGTARQHETLERSLDLLDPGLTRARLVEVLARMHGFWLAAEAGLEEWAARHPADAAGARWPARRRAGLFAHDLLGLRAQPAHSGPDLAPVAGTDEALGRMYVLEGSTLGGTVIDRHLRALPQFAGVRLRCFSPYGADTGAMWHAFRRTARGRVAAGGNAEAMVAGARDTFDALAAWCRPGPVDPPPLTPAAGRSPG
ncbi:biliverdin-producing heme oxygenase [Blastococcus sp. PRF04-17]|uniref:biliverdin-producing heme oxygenase n=1 Tax=Blastococcus sp. PRF04-17 TaxID=2933797 RepID=UPI001FF56050|nr:biliverdin-producing heme oxygenase [Blastococcus sp. PRF04-17]UOY03498.1 biliverdin-producing heme oxygenase [Blastococcus sp. PRF04-17]